MSEPKPVPSGQRINSRLTGIVCLALVVRLLFVAWAPGVPTGDGFYYHLLALKISAGQGFVSHDGSPGILWPPGWPAFMALIYRLVGTMPRAVLVANCFLGAATTALVALIGMQLFDVAAGLMAGLIYAVWPGSIYFCATFFCETAFVFLLVSFLAVTMRLAHAGSLRAGLCFAAGAILGAGCLVKAEPVVLLPIVLALAWWTRRSWREFAVNIVLCMAGIVLVVGPWTYRNYRVFGRFIPTSASGGMNLYVGNTPAAHGRADFGFMILYMGRHRRDNFAQTVVAANAAGYRDAWKSIRSDPVAALVNMGGKLAVTYRGDGEGALIMLGVGGGETGLIPRSTHQALSRVADAFWFGVLLFAAVGLCGLPSWRAQAVILIGGTLVAWTVVQLAVFGGARFHVPQYPVYALTAAVGVRRVATWFGGLFAPAASRKFLPAVMRLIVSGNWKVLLYVLLILLCALFAPQEPLKFIYTEF